MSASPISMSLAMPGPARIVETRSYEDGRGRKRLSLAIRSDLAVEQQITARGATWLDRRLIDKDATSLSGFGAEVTAAMEKRADYLEAEGLARKQGQRIVFARDLLATLRKTDMDNAIAQIAKETGLIHQPASEGDHIAGTYRSRVVLASGRFAMIDDGLGFQLVPWRPGAGSISRRRGEGPGTRKRNRMSFERKRDLGL